MFIPGGCFCCDPPEDPCTLSGCTWSSTDMSDTDLTAGTAYHNQISGSTPDGSYEITNAQEAGTGNDAPCRKITIETIEAPQKPDTVYAICWKDNATHNPSTQCPLTSVSFCVESKRHGDSDSGLTDSVVFVVRQNNRIFATAAQSVGVNWMRASGTYSQNSFTEIDGAGNPNFTATGTSIEFGFALKLLVSEDEEPLDVVMFDNLCITKSATCAGGSPCSDVLCETYNTGDSLVIDSQSSGTGYQVDPAVGLPASSHRYSFDSGASRSVTSVITDEMFQIDECRRPYSFYVCLNFLKSTATTGGSVSFIIRQGANSATAYTSNTNLFSVSEWENRSFSFVLPSYSWLDKMQPVELLMRITENHAEESGVSVWVDNICVRTGYQCHTTNTFAGEVAASFAFPEDELEEPECDDTSPAPGESYDRYCSCKAAQLARSSINGSHSGGSIGVDGTLVLLSGSYYEDFPGFGSGTPTNFQPSEISVSLVKNATVFLGKCSASLFITIRVSLASTQSPPIYRPNRLSCLATYTCDDFICGGSNVFSFASKRVTFAIFSEGGSEWSGCGGSGGGSRTHILPECNVTDLFEIPASVTLAPI